MTNGTFDNSPLGPEDANKRSDIEESFVDIAHLMDGQRIPPNPGTVKIVVGRKGSGKTHILRHIERLSQLAGYDVTFCSIDPSFLQITPLYPSDHKLEEGVLLWTKLWQLALNAAVFSSFNATSRAQKWREKRPELAEIRGRFPILDYETLNPFNPVEALSKFRQRFRSKHSARDQILATDFDLMEQYLGSLLSDSKPMHFIIDGLDELSWMDPQSWLEIQLGLYQLAFQQSHTRSYLRRLHLTVSLRNYVYSHALRHPHSDRIGSGSGLVKLVWDRGAANNFLTERLRNVRGENFAGSDLLIGDRPLANWLGFETIKPARRPNPEPVEQYLLRHTRCAPRQVISMLNALCVEQNKLAPHNERLDPARFCEIVSVYARANADLMIKTAAEELLSILNYNSHLPTDRVRRQSAMDYFLDTVAQGLIRAIGKCKNEICDISEFRSACCMELQEDFSDVAKERLAEAIEGTLWRSCIFAYPDHKSGDLKWKFSWSEGELGFKNPRYVTDSIGFHPTMIDLCNLGVSNAGPVF